MRKRISVIVVLIIVLVIAYCYINQSHRDIENEAAEFEINSTDIASSFLNNSSEAEAKYLNSTIEITGNITEINSNSITLDDKVFCQFTNSIKNTLDKNLQIKIKGRVIGYDDLLEQIKLDQCTINKNQLLIK
ncbi:OB-fold protein [Psychroserpens sp.]